MTFRNEPLDHFLRCPVLSLSRLFCLVGGGQKVKKKDRQFTVNVMGESLRCRRSSRVL